jgi:hypothetical protein
MAGSGRGGLGRGARLPEPVGGRIPPKFLWPGLAGGACSPGTTFGFSTTCAVGVLLQLQAERATIIKTVSEAFKNLFISFIFDLKNN